MLQVGQKRTKSMNEPAKVAAKEPQPSSSDGGAKQALENEFECTICRVSFVEVGLAFIFTAVALCVSWLYFRSCRTSWWPHTQLCPVVTCFVESV